MKLFWIGACWLIGIAAGRLLQLPVWPLIACAVSSLTLAFLFRKRVSLQLGFLAISFFSAGMIRYAFSIPDIDHQHIARLNDSGKRVAVIGMVVDDPDEREHHVNLVVEVENVGHPKITKYLPFHGRILILAPLSPVWRYGQRIRAVGSIQTPPEDESFSYKDYLARREIYSLMSNAEVKDLQSNLGNPAERMIFDARTHAWNVIKALFPEPEASLVSGILLGIESGIKPDLMQDFNRTGTSHIIVISGFNITIIAALCISIFGRIFGRMRGGIIGAISIAVYAILVGADPAVSRAAIMGVITLIAFFLGRQTMALASLAAASMLLTLINPLMLWDLGFLLSFAATLGLVLYADPFKNAFIQLATHRIPEAQAIRLAQPVSEFVLFTIAAQLTTLPLVIYSFQRLPIASLIANPLVLPLQPPLMLLSGLATILGMIWIPLGKPIAWAAWLFPALTIRIVEFISTFPFASISIGHFGIIHLVSSYLLLGWMSILLIRFPDKLRGVVQRVRSHLPTTTVLLLLILAVTLVWRSIADKPDGRTHLYILDVGAGDASLIATPTGRFVLLNGGSSPLKLGDELGRRLTLFHKRVDWLIMSGTNEEQIEGLTGVVDRYTIGKVLVCGPPGKYHYRQLMSQLRSAAVPIEEAYSGQWLDLGGGVRLEVLHRGDRGCLIQITQGNFRWLSTSIQDPSTLHDHVIRSQSTSPSVYLLPDSGSLQNNPPDVLHAINPWIPIISVEAGDPHGLPSERVLRTLQNYNLLRTDVHGTIHVQTDGAHIWISTDR